MVALGDHAGVLNISPYPIAQTEMYTVLVKHECF